MVTQNGEKFRNLRCQKGELTGLGDSLPIEKPGGMSLRQLNICTYVNVESNVVPERQRLGVKYGKDQSGYTSI